MSTQTKWLRLLLTLSLGVICIVGHANQATESVTLYTPYTKISVPPGESIDYAIDVINNSKEIQNVDISVSGMPRGWNYSLKSGAWTIGQLSILPGERKSVSLKVDVPLQVNKGNYRFNIQAGGLNSLPLVVNVSEQGTYKTEFTTSQANMQGNVNSTFTFNTNLRNRTSDKQQYAFMSNAPRGWTVTFKSNYQAVTAIDLDANATQVITVEIKAPDRTEAGKYKIPIRATSSSSFTDLELEVDITGSYNMELSTPTGLLSANITAGESKQLELVIVNTGSSELADIKPEYTAPTNWSVTFDPKKVDKLQPGKSAQVFATIKADKKAIPGDYVTNIETKTPEVSSKVSLRISVETPMLWGWVGVLVILVALGSVYHLFRKYGRR
ncbi:MAG: NEW3 domain-containing protein [Bacteroidetes bacterium]|nr:NEW3 domain-containing protein [Bacteroidota bacterium]MCL6101034.1 NEW3 domain-containing protein [Bacteroidota bacterium]